MAKTILAIDDSTSIRQMVAFTLKSAGYSVIEAADGQEGLAKANATPVPLTSFLPIRICGYGWFDPDKNPARIAAIRDYSDSDADHRIQRCHENAGQGGRRYGLAVKPFDRINCWKLLKR